MTNLLLSGLAVVVKLHHTARLHHDVVDHVDLGAFDPRALCLVGAVPQISGSQNDLPREDRVLELSLDRPVLLCLYLQSKLAHLGQRFPLELWKDHLECQAVNFVNLLSLHWDVHSQFGFESWPFAQNLRQLWIVIRLSLLA